ncbi:M28 family peptidase [Algoriphagus namhaensis]|uniref:M28 family peptidase n=1 Tax=Algoriphagus namhaensis TaxID=915353 RepID=A0ABV8AS77_9BACT
MRHLLVFFLASLAIVSQSYAQEESLPATYSYFDLVRPVFSGQKAYETVSFVEKYWRLAGNTGFNETVFLLATELEKAGYVLEEKANADTRFTYRIEKRPMSGPTWEPVDASLKIIGEENPLLDFSSNRNMMYQFSSSTPDSGIQAEVIYISTLKDLNEIDLEGKILFSDQLSYRRLSAIEGVAGILTYDNPEYLQPEKNQTSIQFRGLRYEKSKEKWAIALSYEAKEKLKMALVKGKVELDVRLQTKIYESEELTLVAQVKGSQKPLESLMFSAHIQEPGANDNASGVGAQLEMATLTANLIESGQLDLSRTLTFLWGDEIISTRRYVEEKEKRQTEIKWGISLDMVGENTDVTGGTFLIEKMPDPSAIWTRGEDKHTEWGGRPLKVEDMKPHYLNDFILNVFQNQGKNANWQVETNPFEGGSDHTPFLNANIPGLLLWHFTDQFYHTDNDRLDKVSQETLKNVATGALVSAYTLLNADESTASQMAKLILQAAKSRLQTEFELSQKAIQAGEDPEEEKIILQTWTDWYLASLEGIVDIASVNEIKSTQEELSAFSGKLLKQL